MHHGQAAMTVAMSWLSFEGCSDLEASPASISHLARLDQINFGNCMNRNDLPGIIGQPAGWQHWPAVRHLARPQEPA